MSIYKELEQQLKQTMQDSMDAIRSLDETVKQYNDTINTLLVQVENIKAAQSTFDKYDAEGGERDEQMEYDNYMGNRDEK